MKPGVIVNISRNNNDVSIAPNDWYREEKWKRITDWITEIEKETIKNRQELATDQTRKIKSMIESIQTKEKYKEKSLPSYYLAEIEKLDRSWDRINPRRCEPKSRNLQEENEIIRREIEHLDEMKNSLKYRN